MPEDKKHSGEAAGKEFAIATLVRDMFEASPDPRIIDITYSGKGGTKESPDMSVALKREADGTHSIEQQLGSLSGANVQINDQWEATLDSSGRVESFTANGAPLEIVDSGATPPTEGQIGRIDANAKVIGALQSLRTLVLPGVF